MNKKKIFGLIILVLILGFSLIFLSLIFKPGWSSSEEELLFSIQRGESVSEIAENLRKQKAISSEYAFLGYLALTGKSGRLQAGTYNLTSDMTILDVVDKVTNGEIVSNSATIIEGWNLREIAHSLDSEGLIDKKTFFKVTGLSTPQANLEGIDSLSSSYNQDLKLLKDLPKGVSLEGYLFPDTYRFSNETEEEIVNIMIRNTQRRMEEANLFEKIENSDINIHEAITMASLIEKEVPDYEDMRKVSDILWRRLEAGMPLQVDATVNYVTGRRGIDVTIDETEIGSPFNTYQVTGLPAGPIASPSINSLKAALDPNPNNYWYYLSDPKTGDTIFSRNHLEHVRAKNQYLR